MRRIVQRQATTSVPVSAVFRRLRCAVCVGQADIVGGDVARRDRRKLPPTGPPVRDRALGPRRPPWDEGRALPATGDGKAVAYGPGMEWPRDGPSRSSRRAAPKWTSTGSPRRRGINTAARALRAHRTKWRHARRPPHRCRARPGGFRSGEAGLRLVDAQAQPVYRLVAFSVHGMPAAHVRRRGRRVHFRMLADRPIVPSSAAPRAPAAARPPGSPRSGGGRRSKRRPARRSRKPPPRP